jgi:hypothetical protein
MYIELGKYAGLKVSTLMKVSTLIRVSTLMTFIILE